MTELEEFRDYCLTYPKDKYFPSALEEFVGGLGFVLNEYLRKKAEPKGFHRDCTSTKHAIGAGYCQDCHNV